MSNEFNTPFDRLSRLHRFWLWVNGQNVPPDVTCEHAWSDDGLTAYCWKCGWLPRIQ